MRAKNGFTLVEILIVVIILGILAAIVVPQFTDASTQAKISSIKSDLQTIRSQIELYKAQHNPTLPAPGAVTFDSSMTHKTTLAGVVDDANGAYGPYLQAIPVNPYNNLNTVRKDSTAAGANTHGWRFSSTGATAGAFQSDYDATTAAY
jgi:general secretion pathway protein G